MSESKEYIFGGLELLVFDEEELSTYAYSGGGSAVIGSVVCPT